MSMRFRIYSVQPVLTVVLRVKQIGQRRATVGALAIGIVFPALRVLCESFVAQTDLAFGRAQLDDLELAFLA